jgi:hypothetical protein
MRDIMSFDTHCHLQDVLRQHEDPVLVSSNIQPVSRLSSSIVLDHLTNLFKRRRRAVDKQVNAALGHIDSVEEHVSITGRRVASNQDRLLPLINVGQDSSPLAREPRHRRVEVSAKDQIKIGFLVVDSIFNLLPRVCQGARRSISQERRHADHVLGLDVVAVLGIRSDESYKLFRCSGDHVDVDAVGHERVVQLDLPSENLRRADIVVDDDVAVPVFCRNRAVVSHQLVDVAFELAEREASPNLRHPWVAEEVVELAQARVVAVQRLGEVAAVFEVDQLQLLREVRASENSAILEERQ